ncbi:zinc finger HIT domain-containing protein 3-like [Ruditapes philippinarum]|uniref:zinc finger HIT domain-containing protein 3-like n=1 Tax=Ruditapes philippinarum TaxID=129788 RepID=UPI00295BC59B|nr:zinc finger HIT domain-containing protein 3-like [Ruditapes philippinarum]XP_060588496.1 zinc finger HIT domain-containing protein 3-like [Ruditapes philippinarum]
MIKKAVCEICKEVEHKYRCPQCKIVYCSLPCYKTHKEGCNKKEVKEEQTKIEDLTETSETLVPEFMLDDDQSEDRVSIEQLQCLENSEKLKDMLSNPHLRQLMTSLVHSGNAGTQLEKAMQEPIFTEFADTCLNIIDNKTNST